MAGGTLTLRCVHAGGFSMETHDYTWAENEEQNLVESEVLPKTLWCRNYYEAKRLCCWDQGEIYQALKNGFLKIVDRRFPD